MSKRRYKPVYGFGWFREGETSSIEVPPEFTLDIDQETENYVCGVVKIPHLFQGKKVELTLRTKDAIRSHYNVRVFGESGKPELTGFAELVG